ncbi:FAD:protein FMN transferase [Dyadobacter psychrotolerans]|uniref:FAD:protein FMN transferase n=1 Tax=Dyadobacter psychrotolerans TaxID=2541721 RepID=A0A4R5DNP9_9BACT|nr:FAD:protein FMN transferase [Dyadobacter psychrotolerans]TDE13740.1 FAD:protein FMN transferase [Dyadobacter psychrotolerans]
MIYQGQFRLFNAGILALGFLCFFSNKLEAQERRYTFERGLMGSPFKLIIYAPGDSIANAAANSAFKRIEDLNAALSDYRDDSEINSVSARSGSKDWIPVSKDLFDILYISNDISKKTKGAFDATLGPIVQEWRRATRKGYFPDKKLIAAALAKTGYKKIEFNEDSHKIKLNTKGMRLDIGGLGKGYAADEAVKVLQSYGITSAMIDAGGKLALMNPPPGEKGWKIVISTGSDSIRTIEYANVGIATSGPTYRYLEYKGKRYSHIVDPKTGIGLQFHLRTTVISPNATEADALATAFSVSGINEGKKYLKLFPDNKVWLVEMKGDKISSWNTIE